MRGLILTVFLSSVLSLATVTPVPNTIDSTPRPALSGHRGGVDLWPENTLTAFKGLVAEYPGAVVEMDVRPLSDGTLVVVHDATTDRTSATKGTVKNMTPEQWANVRINGPGGSTAPASTFKQVIDHFKDTNVTLLVELKDSTAADKFIEMVWPIRNQVVVAAFPFADASRLARSGLRTMQLIKTTANEIIPDAMILGANHSVITPAYVTQAHNAGQEVWAWTVNTQTRIDELIAMGVDGIITNDPRLVIPS